MFHAFDNGGVQLQDVVNNIGQNGNGLPNVDNIDAAVAAEIVKYKQEPEIAMFDNENNNQGHRRWTNPLAWWKIREITYPYLAISARHILCIPATSAPSERLFSHAGLTIAKDRANLDPEIAEDLIFLHDAWPVMNQLIDVD